MESEIERHQDYSFQEKFVVFFDIVLIGEKIQRQNLLQPKNFETITQKNIILVVNYIGKWLNQLVQNLDMPVFHDTLI